MGEVLVDPEHLRSFLARPGDESVGGEAHFAPAAPPPEGQVFPEGVVWRAPWEQPHDGTAIATRRYVKALLCAGMAVRLVSVPGGMGHGHLPVEDALDPGVLAEVGSLRHTALERTLLQIDHLVPSYRAVEQRLYPGGSLYVDPHAAEKAHPFRVLLTVWERKNIDPMLGSLLDRAGGVWVPCSRNAEWLTSAGVSPEKVHVVPHPYLPDSEMLPIARGRAFNGIRQAGTNFYSVGKWEPRKNHHTLIGAFLRTFRPEEHARLRLKTSEFGSFDGYPKGPLESLALWLEDEQVRARGWTKAHIERRDRVQVFTRPWSELEMAQFHVHGDVYVSTSHGEAWDLPAFDAVLARARLLHVGFGGSEDYAPENSLFLSDGDSTEPCHPGYGWGAGRWAKVDIDRVGAAMRIAHEDRQIGDEPDYARFSLGNVGKRMRELCEEQLAKARGGSR